MSTINDVAKKAGVSKSTVSNVFSGKRPISKEVQEKVIKTAKELNYKPNYLARSLATKQSKIIGLNIAGNITRMSQYHLSFINGVLKECHEKGYSLLINTHSDQYTTEQKYRLSAPTDGEILLDPKENDRRITNNLKDNIPTVIVGRPPEKYRKKVSYVTHDNIEISKQMTKYLLDLGHRDILFLNTLETTTVSQDRVKGYELAYEETGKEINPDHIVFNPPNQIAINYGYHAAIKMLSQNKNITAIIADSDNIAQGVYNALWELKLKIPEDMAVMAYSYCEPNRFTPSLTCVDLESELMGVETTKMLIEQCTLNTPILKKSMMPFQLIPRESTGYTK